MHLNSIIHQKNQICIAPYRYVSSKCTGRLNKPKGNDDSRHFVIKGEHFHSPDARVVNKANSMHKLKKLAKETRIPAREIVGLSIEGISNATAATISTPKQLVQMVNRARYDKNAPKNPKKLSELWFGDKHSKTESGKEFILWDSGHEMEDEDKDKHRTIVFGTTDNVQFLAQCTHWMMDGTFKSSPHLFKQLYTIHGKIHSSSGLFSL